MFRTHRKAADTFAGCGKNRVRNGRSDGRDRWFSHSKRFGGIGWDDVDFNRGRVAHPSDGEIGIGALLRRTTTKGDLAFQGGGNTPDDSTFHLLLNTNGVDDD